MRHFLGNVISVVYSCIRFFVIKLFHWNSFYFYPIERISPNVIVAVGRRSRIELGDKVRVHSFSRISAVAGGKLRIGDNCRFNYNCMIVCRDSIEIEPGVEFGPNVLIYDHDHDFRAPGGLKAGKFKTGPVRIGENSWIGANTVILRNTTIGSNCVIAAGSIVKGNIPDNTILVQKRENNFIERVCMGDETE